MPLITIISLILLVDRRSCTFVGLFCWCCVGGLDCSRPRYIQTPLASCPHALQTGRSESIRLSANGKNSQRTVKSTDEQCPTQLLTAPYVSLPTHVACYLANRALPQQIGEHPYRCQNLIFARPIPQACRTRDHSIPRRVLSVSGGPATEASARRSSVCAGRCGPRCGQRAALPLH